MHNFPKYLLATTLLIASSIFSQAQRYKDPDLTPHERAEDLIKLLTLEEKAQLMMHTSPAIPRLGIPEFNWWSEALHGVGRNGIATVFPVTIGMAASFDDGLVEKVFNAVSDEARAKNNIARKEGRCRQYEGLSFWTPNINIFRDPRWGRGQETYGEDPYLTSRMGLAVVRGLQGPEESPYRKLFACAKHFSVHSGPEWNRHYFNIETVSPRDLWETYLPAFKALVQDGKVREVMCAYQRLEDEPCCGSNRLLQQILRKEWGFTGLVTSDCWAVNDFWNLPPKGHAVVKDKEAAVSKAVLSGTDLECGNTYGKTIPQAVAEGLVSEADIDQNLIRLLAGRFELGDFDPDSLVEWRNIGPEVIASSEHHQLALNIAHESIVLLKNGNAETPTLPLRKDMKVAVIGPNANDSVMLWGNYNGYPAHTTTLLEGIRRKVGADNVVYLPACGHVRRDISEAWYNKIRDNKRRVGMNASYWNNSDFQGEPVKLNNYRTHLAFDNSGATSFSQDVNITQFSAQYNGTLHADKTDDIHLILKYTDRVRIIVDGDTLLSDWQISTDEVRNKKIPYHVEQGHNYKIQIDYSQAEGSAVLAFDVARQESYTDEQILAATSDADAVIFVGGISPALEGEEMLVDYPGFKGGDRTDIDLPQVQHDIMEMLHKAGRTIVFVNCSGSAMAMVPEVQNANAIIQAWYGGEAGGEALADVLFGDFNPCGKLPVTFYRNTQQLPDFLDYSMKGRTYRYFTGTPLWEFGYGMSYTQFHIGKARIKNNILNVKVTNTGQRAGTEVVQVYVKNNADTEGPLKTLKAYKRVQLNPGETQNIEIPLTSTIFELFDPESNTIRDKHGLYTLFYGTSSSHHSLQTIQISH